MNRKTISKASEIRAKKKKKEKEHIIKRETRTQLNLFTVIRIRIVYRQNVVFFSPALNISPAKTTSSRGVWLFR